jgi:hypothetical protein
MWIPFFWDMTLRHRTNGSRRCYNVAIRLSSAAALYAGRTESNAPETSKLAAVLFVQFYHLFDSTRHFSCPRDISEVKVKLAEYPHAIFPTQQKRVSDIRTEHCLIVRPVQ